MHPKLETVVGNRGQVWPVPAGGSGTDTVTVPASPAPAAPAAPGTTVDPASGFPDAVRHTQVGAPAPAAPPAEPHHSAAQPRDDAGRFTAEQLEKARQEEKDKLYPELEKMREDLAELRAEREARIAKEKEAEEAAAAAAEAARVAELSAVDKVAEIEKTFQARLDQMQQEREAEKLILQREQEFQQLRAYAAEKVAEAGDDLLPELRDLVTGTTPEEIDASVTTLVARSSAIVEGAQQAMAGVRAAQPGVSITGAPPAGPVENNDQAYKTFTLEDLKDMDMATFMKNRASLLGAASQQQNRGMFG